MAILSTTEDFGKKLCRALGLPKTTRSFDLHVGVDEAVTCKAEIYVEPDMQELETIFIEYELVKK